MGRKRKLKAQSVGGYGYKVEVRERANGVLYLRARGRWKSLGHSDWDAALKQAREVSADLLAARSALRTGARPIAVLFARYEQEVSEHKKGAQPAEDRRRIEMWTAWLRGRKVTDARRITPALMRAFERDRRAGRVRVPGRTLAQRPNLSTIGADIIFLQSVLNWATTEHDGDERLLDENPLKGYSPPRSTTKKQPVASWDRFIAVYRYTDRADPQRLFRIFLLLIEETGWRVSAVCQLRMQHFDLAARPEAPYGRIWRDGDIDKESSEGWVPLSPLARRAVELLRRRRKAIGDAYAFPAPRRRGKPWSRWHARDLLERAERLAGLQPIEGGDFHPYRRAWCTSRKHHPAADVMALQGRRDRRTLEKSYQMADTESMLAAVLEPRRVRQPVPKAAEPVAAVVAGRTGK